MRYQFVVDFPGTLAELIASFPPGADVISLHHVPNVEVDEPKSSGARRHMGEYVVAGIFADFDAGMTIEAIAAKIGYSYRAVAARRKEWKELRVKQSLVSD